MAHYKDLTRKNCIVCNETYFDKDPNSLTCSKVCKEIALDKVKERSKDVYRNETDPRG